MRFLNGDNEAFKQLWLRHQPRVRSLIVKKTSNFSWHDDIEQNVAIKLIQKLDTFKAKSAFTSWLHTIVVNEVFMYARKEQRFLKFIEELPVLDHSPSFENQIAAKEELILLKRRVDKHRIKHDSKILFLRGAGYCDGETAKILKLSRANIKASYHRNRHEQRRLTRCNYSSVCGDSGGDDLLGSARVA